MGNSISNFLNPDKARRVEDVGWLADCKALLTKRPTVALNSKLFRSPFGLAGLMFLTKKLFLRT